MMPVDEMLTRWMIRLALVLYAAGLAAILLGRRRRELLDEARLVWTAGCVCLWLHLGAAFHFYHDWSHRAAYEDTARDTAAAIGIAFGEGVYLNYLFAVVWTVDVFLWWRQGPNAPFVRPAWQNWLVHGFLLFIAFNATVTFGEGAVRWIAVALFAVLAVVAWRVHGPVA
jgi:hypothetical protein